MISSATATLWYINYHSNFTIRAETMRVKILAEETAASIQGNWTPAKSDPFVSRAHALNHEREKERKAVPTSRNCGVNIRATGVSMSFCFFLSLYQNLPKVSGIIIQTQVSFCEYQPQVRHGGRYSCLYYYMEVLEMALSSEGLSLLQERWGTCRERESSGGFSRVRTVACGRAWHGTEYCRWASAASRWRVEWNDVGWYSTESMTCASCPLTSP